MRLSEGIIIITLRHPQGNEVLYHCYYEYPPKKHDFHFCRSSKTPTRTARCTFMIYLHSWENCSSMSIFCTLLSEVSFCMAFLL